MPRSWTGWAAGCLAAGLAACATAHQGSPAFGEIAVPGPSAEARAGAILESRGINTAQIGVIKDGELVWQASFGERAPGKRATETTRFNTASITKTVVAETVLRLAEQGLIDLDEPMARYHVDPDIADDPNLMRLTPRLVLSHSTGFPNWRFFRADGKLVFEEEPGSGYTYSGEGMQYLARFTEKKLGRPFPELVEELTLAPIGMENTSFTVDPEAFPMIAETRDTDGTFYGHYCRPPYQGSLCEEHGSYSAAGGMASTVSDYAAFLGVVRAQEGYGPGMAKARSRIITPFEGEDRVIHCETEASDVLPCPEGQGYGLGFEVIAFENDRMIGHGGWDWTQLTIAYLFEGSGDGLIIFINAPNETAQRAMPELIELFDPASPYLPQYRRWAAR